MRSVQRRTRTTAIESWPGWILDSMLTANDRFSGTSMEVKTSVIYGAVCSQSVVLPETISSQQKQ